MAVIGRIMSGDIRSKNELRASCHISNPTRDAQAVRKAEILLRKQQTRLANALLEQAENEVLRVRNNVIIL